LYDSLGLVLDAPLYRNGHCRARRIKSDVLLDAETLLGKLHFPFSTASFYAATRRNNSAATLKCPRQSSRNGTGRPSGSPSCVIFSSAWWNTGATSSRSSIPWWAGTGRSNECSKRQTPHSSNNRSKEAASYLISYLCFPLFSCTHVQVKYCQATPSEPADSNHHQGASVRKCRTFHRLTGELPQSRILTS
jgi:hypothetical protein